MARLQGNAKRPTWLAAVIVGLIILLALWAYLLPKGGSGGGGGGGGGGTTTTAPMPAVYPTGDIYNGYNLILLEDFVNPNDYQIVVSAFGEYSSIPVYGGSGVQGNITHEQAYLKYGGFSIPIIAIASTNSTLKQDFPGMQIRLDTSGGYILYTAPNLAIYYRHMAFNVSGTTVHVWAPASQLPPQLSGASHHVTIDPANGVAYVDGMPVKLSTGVAQPQRKGVLRAWLVMTSVPGTYTLTINP
ncbi:hypothetical protein QIT50_gp08 [Pyrobaculum spherical virus 2]|uniref:Uncharacterized protein n=1 Tax=Pyrobaculum spherical virus 2 TaxID=2730632 RepID=A0A6M3VZ12_9VIRU|nr:hypothetical protein QIT50_gp08 [Pyrobaculum spherical virus 2]QJF12420.1 hypothetical protein PSV2_gp08 [Pyrobaculum spherical virus 2]